MQTINYPSEQMHRFDYTDLSIRQINRKLRNAESAPRSDSELSNVLAGQTLTIVTEYPGGNAIAVGEAGESAEIQKGPTLNYSFSSASKLTLTVSAEGNDTRSESGYGALEFGNVVMYSHMVPDQNKGYSIIIDRDTRLATVFEAWFSEPLSDDDLHDTREVQRQIYYGYVTEDGKEPPPYRHHLTNRIEGKGIHWTQDNGIETLEFFPSVIYSNFVELTRYGGELSFCAPSDYIKINDHQYVYSRVEAEFSGVMTLYTLDLHKIKQVGMRLGFDANDDLEYYLFRGHGEIVGQVASFEPLDFHGEAVDWGNRQVSTEKGWRSVYRPAKTNPILTEQETEEAIAKNIRVFPEQGLGIYKMPVSDYLVGKELTLRLDHGPTVEYQFKKVDELRWRYRGERRWRTERYQSWQPEPGVIFLGHLLRGEPKHDVFKIVLDFDNALTTVVHGTMGTQYVANEAAAAMRFGVIEMAGITPPKYRRHQHTDELVGHTFAWNYAPGLTALHYYATPHSMSWIIAMQNGAGGLEWSGPAEYAKIRDGLYLFYFLEEACNGTLGTIVINTKTMHDCGASYHAGPDGLRLSTIGAYGRKAGQLDTKKFFKARG